MHEYFDSDAECQRVFVLYGLGGSGKSQIAFKFLRERQTNKLYSEFMIMMFNSLRFWNFSFSDIFYIDATNEQTLQMDLKGIGPETAQDEQSVDVILRWLANQQPGEWLLFFDNADDVHLNLKKFFPPCTSGNILITTRNRELRLYTEGSDQNVTGMDEEDATNLLLRLSQAEKTDENKALAEQIAQVFSRFFLFAQKSSQTRATTGTPLLRIGSLTSW